MQQLSENFLVELFKGCITSNSIITVVHQHLKYHFLPSDGYKSVWRAIKSQYEITSKPPTIGVLNEMLKQDQKGLDVLSEMSQVVIMEKKEQIVGMFEVFLRKVMFIDLQGRVVELYNQGKAEESIKTMAVESEQIHNFNLKKSVYATVFGGFEKRQEKRKQKKPEDIHMGKVPFGIDSIDYDTRGGIKRGTSALILGRSGGGKSTLKRWVGLHNARCGNRVVHFQAEGTEEDCLDGYDAAWTSISLECIEFGQVSAQKEIKIKRVHQDIVRGGGEIIVIASEQFDSMYIEDCREVLVEIEKTIGQVDLAIFDYLEIFNSRGRYNNDQTGERKRREDVANKITNLATEFKHMATLTSTQANDIKEMKWNDPEYVMTRSDIAEYKAAVKPFSYFLTLNQTKDEYDKGVLRIYEEKFRFHKFGRTRHIYQALDIGRFYDVHRTRKHFWDIELNKEKK